MPTCRLYAIIYTGKHSLVKVKEGFSMLKKSLAICLLAASVFVPVFADQHSAEARPVPPAAGDTLVPPRVRESNELQNISERFGVKTSELQKYFDMGWGFKELRHAAVLTLATNKDMGAILTLKQTNSWPRVEYLLGVTPNDMKAARDKNDARYFAGKLGVSESELLALLQQNYGVGESLHAMLLAKAGGTTAAKVLEMHNPPQTTWREVADSLGVTFAQLEQIREDIDQIK